MSLTIYTWKGGSKGLGLKTPVKSTLLGGNVGHAALELTWPASEEGDKLAKKYQQAHGVIISKRTEIVGELQENGSHIPKEQVAYFAYFSWWPGYNNGHNINSFKEDQDAEWRHEPERKMHPGWKTKIYGSQGMGEENTTEVTGMFIQKRDIQKLKSIEHMGLKYEISQDTAYQELIQRKEVLNEEYQALLLKKSAFEQECETAIREGRKSNPEFELTEEDFARIATIPGEFSVVEAQLNLCMADFVERHLSSGKQPDCTMTLPTSLDTNDLLHTLDTENMLREMINLANGERAYNLTKFNCSTSVCRIIKAGVDENLKETLRENGFDMNRYTNSLITTPTNINTLGLKLQDALLKLELANHMAPNPEQGISRVKQTFNELKTRLRAVVTEVKGDNKTTDEATVNPSAALSA